MQSENLLVDYITKESYAFFHLKMDGKYIAVKEDYCGFIYLEWYDNLKYPSVKMYYCYNNSTKKDRIFIGFPYAGSVELFRKNFKKDYIKYFGRLRWFFRPILKPFFKLMTKK